MIFFDGDDFWRTEAEMGPTGANKPGILVEPMIRHILTYGITSPAKPKDAVDASLLQKLLFTTDHAAIIAALREHAEKAQNNLSYALAAEPLKIATLRMNRR
ncbi:hypothetical protein XH99_28590 [Bradyrhizobium nanningense]|uniref:Uncharacterized protein n=1 Tax=Bradyrhizobium nanningense TaxID=1325118 RepID=A0A4Q0RX96_9BRAD|nr:hypothetical protein [Bradyrhizobium nanningense]RXH24054.1 hypothetical protein XH99_28590 [Bradyrhizobium nanningense]